MGLGSSLSVSAGCRQNITGIDSWPRPKKRNTSFGYALGNANWVWDYGELPVHGGLWGIARETVYDVAVRVALVPRCLEARGLDVTPGMIEKLHQVDDSASATILERILEEKVGHVGLGSRWFSWVCQRRGIDFETERLVEHYLPVRNRGCPNFELRRRAGFSEWELRRPTTFADR